MITAWRDKQKLLFCDILDIYFNINTTITTAISGLDLGLTIYGSRQEDTNVGSINSGIRSKFRNFGGIVFIMFISQKSVKIWV